MGHAIDANPTSTRKYASSYDGEVPCEDVSVTAEYLSVTASLKVKHQECPCNCRIRFVTAFLAAPLQGRGEDGPSGRCGDPQLRIRSVTLNHRRRIASKEGIARMRWEVGLPGPLTDPIGPPVGMSGSPHFEASYRV